MKNLYAFHCFQSRKKNNRTRYKIKKDTPFYNFPIFQNFNIFNISQLYNIIFSLLLPSNVINFYFSNFRHNVLPIVMGAHPTDYARSAPYRSYIHVDEFESPKELAEYLHRLDRDDELYNSYFRWKGTGEFINTYFWCRVCAMLHDDRPPKFYKDVNDWWRGDGICTTTSWREHDSVRAGNLKNT